MEIRIADCPLGAKCEEVKTENDKQILYRCSWVIKIRGKDPQSEIEIDEWKCSVAWQPILSIENTQQSRQTGAAVEDLRNEMVKGQSAFNTLISDAQKRIGVR